MFSSAGKLIQRYKEWKLQSERESIARSFNNLYTYRTPYIENRGPLLGRGLYDCVVDSGYAWMCPKCNEIHHPIRMDGLVGLIYPPCCGQSAPSHRLNDGIKTK